MELTDKERFLLHYLRNRQISWGIDAPVKKIFGDYARVIQDLKHDGYLIDDDNSYFLETKSVAELKNILKELSLSQIGKKDELIKRIKAHTSNTQREKICSELYYVLTDKGIAEEKKYWVQKKNSDSRLKETVYNKISNGNFVEASQKIGEVYSKAIIPPGIGIDWNDKERIDLRTKAELDRIKEYDFSDLENSYSFIEILTKILYYDKTIEHNLQSSITQFISLTDESLHCKDLDNFFQEKNYTPSESDKLFVYLDTKRYNAFQNNMRTLLKKSQYKPLPKGVFNISDSTILFWKEHQIYTLLMSKNIEGFPKTFNTYQKHKEKNSEKYQSWLTHLQ